MFDWFEQFDLETQSTIWILTIGAMTNVACAVVGCFLVLRRMSLIGDAISHSVLPGLVIAFLLSGTFSIGYMFVGALIAALLTTFLTEVIHRHGGVPTDASMGVVFTSLFALGVLLVKQYGTGIHLDIECLLSGELAFVDRIVLPGTDIPRSFVAIGIVLLINLFVLILFWKELKVSAFDPALSTTLGFSSKAMHYLLMGLISITTVASFEQVGVILVVAMLIAPGATAHLLADRLRNVIIIAVAVAIVSSVGGYYLATWLDANIAGAMSVTVGLCYAVAVLFSPRYGIISKMIRNFKTSLRIVKEDILAMLYRLDELAIDRSVGSGECRSAMGGGLLPTCALISLRFSGQIENQTNGLRLSDEGRQRAEKLVRSHRLWEAFLVQYLGLPLDHVHDPATRMEHFIDDTLQESIASDLDDAARDPHGRDIPQE